MERLHEKESAKNRVLVKLEIVESKMRNVHAECI